MRQIGAKWKGDYRCSTSYRLQHLTEATQYKQCCEAVDPKFQFQRDEREHTLSD